MSVCDVIPFPLQRRGVLVREIASELARTHGEAANQLWRGIAKRHLKELQDHGQSAAAAENEVRMLFAAVHAEIQRTALAVASV